MYLLVLKGAHLKTINTKFQLLTAEGSIFLLMGMRCESCIRLLLLYRVWICLNMVNACAFINCNKFLLAIFICRQKPEMGRQIFSQFPCAVVKEMVPFSPSRSGSRKKLRQDYFISILSQQIKAIMGEFIP